MYVLSSMPVNKQSIAGSLFQTLTRLCTAVSYGIATAIFDAVQNKPAKSGYYAHNKVEPYAAVFWFSAATSFLGLFFVPFLRITTQGHKGDKGRFKTDTKSGLVVDDGHVIAAQAKGMEENGSGERAR